MKKINKIIFTILAFLFVVPFTLTACINDNKPVDTPPQPTPEPEEQVVEPDDNPNSPLKSGIYYFEKEELSLDDMFYLDDGTNAINHFHTRDINGIRLELQDEETYHFNEFAKSITKVDGKLKCYEFNTQNQITIYKINNGVYEKLTSFNYVYENTFFKGLDGDKTPFILYKEDEQTFSIAYKFFYTNENGERVFPYIYIKAGLVYVNKSLDLLTAESKTLSYKEGTAKLVNSTGEDLNADEYKEVINKKFNLELTENVMEELTSRLATYNVYLNTDLSLVVTSKNGDEFKFSLKSINNNVVDYSGNTYNVKTQFADTNQITTLSVETTVDENVVLSFEFEVK